MQQSAGAAVGSLPLQPLLPPALLWQLRWERGRVSHLHSGEPQSHGHVTCTGSEARPARPLQPTGSGNPVWPHGQFVGGQNKRVWHFLAFAQLTWSSIHLNWVFCQTCKWWTRSDVKQLCRIIEPLWVTVDTLWFNSAPRTVCFYSLWLRLGVNVNALNEIWLTDCLA